jgi:tetratricopeptide (TPR) repeat protein
MLQIFGEPGLRLPGPSCLQLTNDSRIGDFRVVGEEEARRKPLAVPSSSSQWQGSLSLTQVANSFSHSTPKSGKEPTAYAFRGHLFVQKKNFDKALTDFSKAVELAPDNPNAYVSRGIGYLWKKDYEKATMDFSKAIKLNPRDDEPYVGRGDAHYCLEKYDKALADYEQACQLAPKNIEALLGRARTFDELKNLDKALADYTRVIELDPKNVKGHLGQARTRRKQGEFDQARVAYTTALQLDPENPDGLLGFAWFLASCPETKMRDGEKALRFAKKACDLENGGDSWSFQVLAAAHAELGNFPEAVEWQKKAVAKGVAADTKMAELTKRLKLYEDKKPYRESSQSPFPK